jgi:GTP pyrophosphokinase
MSKIKNELEELAFKHLEPDTYKMVQGWVSDRRRATEETVGELKMLLDAKLSEAQISIVSIEGRIKRLFSIREKIRRQKIALEEVHDLIAVRVITPSIKDCYTTLGIVHQIWSPVPGHFKDFVAMPRPNGYQSLHTLVVSDRGFSFEVQIRTEEMHRVAEAGIAAHWKYKEGRVGAHVDEDYFRWVRHLLEWQEDVRDPGQFIHSLKVDLYQDEVYAFTPKGEVKALPRRATSVDFAYSVHTDVGHTCVGARVNGKMVPLRTQLKSGDIVDVVTGLGQKPKREWLNFVSTARARNKIKHFLHTSEKARAIELGHELVEREIRRFNLDSKRLLGAEKFGEISGVLGVKKIGDLFLDVGYGKLSARAVVAEFVPEAQLTESEETVSKSVIRRGLRPSEDKIKVHDFDDLFVFRARCCNPIRGEKIVGYMTRGKGVSVHLATCQNVLNLFYDVERRIEVAWGKSRNGEASAFTVGLAIRVEDRRGILADVTSRIAEIKVNVRKVDAMLSGDSHARINVTLDITDLKHLQRVVKVVTNVSGVLDVERVLRQIN